MNLVNKITAVVLLSCGLYFTSNGQNVGINTDGSTPDASAMLDVKNPNKGLLIPRVALTASNVAGPITSPTTSLLVYNTATAGTNPNTVIPGYYYWNGTSWIMFSSTSAASTAWVIGGNSGVTSSNFLGTADDRVMTFRSNNQPFLEFGNRGTLGLIQPYTDYTDATEKVTHIRSALQFEAPAASFYKPKMWTDTDGNFRVKGASAGTDYFEFGATGSANAGGFEFVIGDDGDEPILFKSYHYVNGYSEIMRLQSGRMSVGSNAFDATNPEKLLIDAGTTSSYNLMTGKGSIDNYLQINIKNQSGGGSASSDVVASSNNGTESVNFIDMGINSGGYSNTSLPVLGGANTAYLYATGNDFVIGNATATKPLRFFTGGTANANERMRIDGTGKVGIANLAPTEALDVTGNMRFSGALMPNNLPGTLGYVLQSNGSGAAPTWVTPGTITASTAWALDGNAVAANRNFGTTSNFSIPFITNSTEKMRLFNTGGLAIGATSLDGSNPEKLLVDAGTTSSFNVISGKGSINNYLQLNIQNRSTGAAASSDIVASANNATELLNFVDLGINSSGYSSTGLLGGANVGYLYSTGADFVIGNATANKDLSFFTGGTATSNERMTITGTGNVGIAKTVPSEALDVTGNMRFSGALMPNGLAGTSGHILQSNGAGTAPTWVAAATSSDWSRTGNVGTTAGTDFIGTTDDEDLVFKTDGSEAMRLYSGGGLELDAGTGSGTTASSALYASGTYNNYLEFNVQNLSNGALASSDIVATANNGSGSSVYIDMGINSAGYSNSGSNILNGSNVAYLYAHGIDFKIGNGTPGRDLVFFTNPSGGTLGTNTANGIARMYIEDSGDVGIGTSNPAYLLHVNGSAGKPGGGDWTAASDKRLKKDIKPFSEGLSVLTKINPVWYQYNGMGGMPNDGKNYVGVIAQDMQVVAPYMIGTFKDAETNIEYLNYDANAVTYILINSVKEQQAEIEALKKRLEDQNQRLLKLEEKLK